MADQKLSQLTELAATPATDDEVYIRDVSEAAAQESKRIAISNLMLAAVAAVEETGLTLAALKNIIFANDGVLQFGTEVGATQIKNGRGAEDPHIEVQPKAGDHKGEIVMRPSGTNTHSIISFNNASDYDNKGMFQVGVNALLAYLFANKVGTGSAPTALGINLTVRPYVNEANDLGEAAYRWLESWVMHRQLAHPLPVDHTWAGLVAEMQAGAALTIGQACYVGADGKMELADADLATTMPVMALCTPATLAENAWGQFLLQGFFRDDTWDWTPGGIIYASVTPGGLSQTAPVGSGDQVQVVGIAMSADIIYFNPSYELVEIS